MDKEDVDEYKRLAKEDKVRKKNKDKKFLAKAVGVTVKCVTTIALSAVGVHHGAAHLAGNAAGAAAGGLAYHVAKKKDDSSNDGDDDSKKVETELD